MDIIPKSAPEIDPNRMEQSLSEFRDYMVEILELIDFTLSNQKNRIIGAVSEENFSQLAKAVQAMGSDLSSVKSDVNSLSQRSSALETEARNLTVKVADNQAKLSNHEQRILALENS